MRTVHSFPPDLAYVRELVGAGLEGIASTRQEVHGPVFTSPAEPAVWMPAAVGATIGIMGVRLTGRGKSPAACAWGAFLGSVIACGAALAWSSRHFTVPAARNAARSVSAARDAHWLARHPIDYA
jgi:hypothetical protein